MGYLFVYFLANSLSIVPVKESSEIDYSVYNTAAVKQTDDAKRIVNYIMDSVSLWNMVADCGGRKSHWGEEKMLQEWHKSKSESDRNKYKVARQNATYDACKVS